MKSHSSEGIPIAFQASPLVPGAPPSVPADGRPPSIASRIFSWLPWRAIAPTTLVGLVLVTFLPALMADFVDWDDDDLLFKTLHYRDLSWQSLRWMFTTSYAGHFQPLTWLSYSLDWWMWKRNAFGYHLTNVALHAATTLAVYGLARRLFLAARKIDGDSPSTAANQSRDPCLTLCAALAAALFAIHPLRAESVAWLSERRDVLSGFFYVAAVAVYVRFVSAQRRRPVLYGGALLLQLLSLLAKASAATLPFVLLILDAYPLRRFSIANARAAAGATRVFVEKIPFFLVALLGGHRAWSAQYETGAMYPLSEYDLASRAAQAAHGLAFYVGKTVWPVGLGPLYQLPPREVLFGPMLWASILVVALLAGVAVAIRHRRPAVTAALAAYAVILAPVLGFFQSGPQFVADRYSYLSCIGFAILPAALLNSWLRNAPTARRRRRLWPLALAVTILLTAQYHATFRQCNFWSSSLHLWARAVEVSPDSSIAHASLADSLAAIGNLPSAAWHYNRSIELQPRDAITTNHFADLLLRMGDRQRARALYQWTLELDPSRSSAYLRLAQLLVADGRPLEAADFLRQRLRDAPAELPAVEYLCGLLATHPDAAARNGPEAAQLAARLSDARGGDAPSLLVWATALAEAGRFDDAVATARRGLNLAERDDHDRLAQELRRRLELFENQKPYHAGD